MKKEDENNIKVKVAPKRLDQSQKMLQEQLYEQIDELHNKIKSLRVDL